ncbi:MAG TPA: SRPBCC family protein [Actinomycetota bacterium]|nr:SRPBCC family protein [Actinomycetota bacterium]
MAHAERSVTIAAPIETVFAFFADGTNNPKWRSGVLDIARTGDEAGVGATYRQGLKGPGGKRIAGDYRITTLDAPNRLAFEVTAGPARPTGTFELSSEPGSGATTVRFALDVHPTGAARLMGPMISKTMKDEVASLDKAKEVLEQA